MSNPSDEFEAALAAARRLFDGAQAALAAGRPLDLGGLSATLRDLCEAAPALPDRGAARGALNLLAGELDGLEASLRQRLAELAARPDFG